MGIPWCADVNRTFCQSSRIWEASRFLEAVGVLFIVVLVDIFSVLRAREVMYAGFLSCSGVEWC